MTDNPEEAGRTSPVVSRETRPHRPARPASRQAPGPWQRPWQRGVVLLAGLVKLAGRVAALVLALYVIFTVFPANPANTLVRFVGSLAATLSLGLADLFRLPEERWEVLVNYGLAAVVWLVVGSAVAGLIRRAAP